MIPDYSISQPLEEPTLRALSLGAGVQSTVMALMAEEGALGPKPDCAIFADTQWEPQGVYDHLAWLEQQLSFPVYRVTAGSLRDRIGAKRKRGAFRIMDVPAFVLGDNGRPGGMVNRSCTRDFKIAPIQKQVRALVGLTGKRSPKAPIVEQWIGISTDEIQRLKISRDAWISNRWPLIEMRMNRRDCQTWFAARYGARLLAKSSCIGCPFHSDAEWRDILSDPAARADAIEVDERLRSSPKGEYRSTGTLFLHRSCKPLAEVDLSTAAERGQPDLFLGECEGMCGV